MQALVNVHTFNSTQDLVQAVRQERWDTGLKPSVCLWKVCQKRKLILSASERHEILSEIARLATIARRAKRVRQKQSEKEQSIMFSLALIKDEKQTSEKSPRTDLVTVLTPTIKESSFIQDTLPGITSSRQYCNYR